MLSSGRRPAPPWASRSVTRRSKKGRAPTGSSVWGGTVISPVSCKLWCALDRSEHLAQLSRRATALLRLAAHVDLDQHDHGFASQICCPLAQLLSQADRVHGVDRAGELGDELGLVALQMPDHVPAQAVEIREQTGFLGQFLHVAFAEVALTGRVGGAHVVGGLRLRYREQAHGSGFAAGVQGGVGDAFVQRLETCDDAVTQAPLRVCAMTSR